MKSCSTQANGKQTGRIKYTFSAEAKSFIEKPSTEHGVSLKDRLLVAIKDVAEHLASELFKQPQARVPTELAVEKARTTAPPDQFPRPQITTREPATTGR